MSRLRRILLFSAFVVLILGIFVYDVARMTATLDLGGSEYVRQALLVLAFVLIYFFIVTGRVGKSRGVTKEIGKLLAFSVVILCALGLVFFLTPASGSVENNVESSRGALALFLATGLSVALGLFAIFTLLTIKDLALHKRKKGTQRNFLIYLLFLFAATVSAMPILSVEGTLITSFFYPLAIIFIVVISFKQNWIVFLSRREKLYSILYGAILFVGFIVLNFFLTSRNVVSASLMMFDASLQRFIQINSILGAVYFGMAFVSTLFHLPTAEVYERKQSEITSLHNLSRLITQVFDFSDLVDTVTNMTLEVCGAESAWLELVKRDPTSGAIHFDVVSLKNISRGQIEQICSSSTASLRQIVLDSKRVVSIDDARSDRRTRHIKPLGIRVGSMVSVPLVSQNEPIGILHATKDYEFGFDQDDIDVLTTFADHVTIAIENSKLIAESLERERYKQEMMVAQQMQKRLLPQDLPHFPALEIAAMSEPSLEVGGDYYDFVLLDSNRLGIVVGDVSGKGVSAAFYMAEVKGIFQSLSKLCTSPRDLVINANQALKGSLERKAFISLLYGIFDVQQSRLTLARAGHCPMVYISEDQSELLRPLGLGLGLTGGEVFERSTQESVIKLHGGDVCVFYSDGITESRNAEGDEFGYERLVKTVRQVRAQSAEEIKKFIVDEVKSHTANSSYGDDMTLVVVKWLGDAPASERHEHESNLMLQEGDRHHD